MNLPLVISFQSIPPIYIQENLSKKTSSENDIDDLCQRVSRLTLDLDNVRSTIADIPHFIIKRILSLSQVSSKMNYASTCKAFYIYSLIIRKQKAQKSANAHSLRQIFGYQASVLKEDSLESSTFKIKKWLETAVLSPITLITCTASLGCLPKELCKLTNINSLQYRDRTTHLPANIPGKQQSTHLHTSLISRKICT